MKILIVDDEKNIREWLEHKMNRCSDWEVVGCASNGRDALTFFERNKVDIIFTDIKMPVMDGLELLREIRKKNDTVYIVLLTAFSEFELAKQAVNEGANDYILKTEMTTDFLEVLLEKIKKKRDDILKGTKQIELSTQNSSVLREIFLKDMPLTEEILSKYIKYEIKKGTVDLVAIACWKNQFLSDFSFPESKEVSHIVGFEYDETLYIVFKSIEGSRSEQDRQNKIREYTDAIVGCNNSMIGISGKKNELLQIKEAMKEAIAALSIGFYKGTLKAYHYEVEQAYMLEDLEQKSKRLRKLNREFSLSERSTQYKKIEKILADIKKESIFLAPDVMTLCRDILDTLYLKQHNEEDLLKQHFYKAKEKLMSIYTMKEIEDFMLDFSSAYARETKVEDRQLSKGIQLAIEYIQEHFNEALSLEQVAEKVNFNAEYFSRIFKDEMGCTYSIYLTGIRLKKAAQLLIYTNEKVKKIGESVGYPNVSYFSTVFKKNYGINPHEFREKKNEKREI